MAIIVTRGELGSHRAWLVERARTLFPRSRHVFLSELPGVSDKEAQVIISIGGDGTLRELADRLVTRQKISGGWTPQAVVVASGGTIGENLKTLRRMNYTTSMEEIRGGEIGQNKLLAVHPGRIEISTKEVETFIGNFHLDGPGGEFAEAYNYWRRKVGFGKKGAFVISNIQVAVASYHLNNLVEFISHPGMVPDYFDWRTKIGQGMVARKEMRGGNRLELLGKRLNESMRSRMKRELPSGLVSYTIQEEFGIKARSRTGKVRICVDGDLMKISNEFRVYAERETLPMTAMEAGWQLKLR